MHEHPPGAGPVGKLVRELPVRHLPGEADGGLEDVPVAGGELGRGELRPGIVGEAEEVHDILDDLGEDELLPPGNDRHRTGAERSQAFEPAFVFQYVDRFELDPTDREVLLYPEATGSVGLPEHRDGVSHADSSCSWEWKVPECSPSLHPADGLGLRRPCACRPDRGRPVEAGLPATNRTPGERPQGEGRGEDGRRGVTRTASRRRFRRGPRSGPRGAAARPRR